MNKIMSMKKCRRLHPEQFNDQDRFVAWITEKHKKEFMRVKKYVKRIGDCPVCLDKNKNCYLYFKCNHHVCSTCFYQFHNKKCMMCRCETI